MIVVGQGHEQVRAIVAATLVQLGYEVAQAGDGDAVLGYYHRHGSGIKLFVLEKDLSKRSGLDCLRAIRRDGVHTPAVVLADSFNAELVAQLDGNTFLLPKPFQMSQLEGIVRDILHSEGRTHHQA